MAGDLRGWLTSKEAAKRLGVTKKRMHDLELAGKVQVARDFYGRARFNPAELEVLRRDLERPSSPRGPRTRRPDGKICARIFRLFEERKALREIVIETEVSPDDVLSLRRQHAEMGRDLLISPRGLEELRELLDWRGDESEKGLLGAVSSRLRRQFEKGRALGVSERNASHNGEDVSSEKANS